MPRFASRLGAMTTIHSWVFNGTAQLHGGRSIASGHHAEYLIEISRAFASDLKRPIWLQEVGAPANVIEEADAPDFLESTVVAAARSENLWGVTWWCSHDVTRNLVDFPELEHSLGLIDIEGGIKPIGRRFGELAASLRTSAKSAVRETAIVIDTDQDGTPVSRASLSPGGAVSEQWIALCEAGAAPAFVTSVDAAKPDIFSARGIRELVRPDLSASRVSAYSAVNTVVPH